MKNLQLDCGRCNAPISLPLPDASVETTCPACDTYIRVEAFPALLRQNSAGHAETITAGDESSCFYHPAKKAVIPCDGCGRFLCSLCDIEMEGRHLCPACIERGVQKGKFERLRNQTIRYDDIALSLAIIPMVVFWITIFTAPAVLYISLRHWKRPMSVLPRRKWRFVVAVSIAGLQLFGWGFLGSRLLLRLF